MILLLLTPLLGWLTITVQSSPFVQLKPTSISNGLFWNEVPRGGTSSSSTAEVAATEEQTLDEKVHAAMRKLGLTPPLEADDITTETNTINNDDNVQCENGVCELPATTDESSKKELSHPKENQQPTEDPQRIAERISTTLKVDINMAWAALGATSTSKDGDNSNERIYNEKAATDMIQLELEMIAQIQEDSIEVQQLVSEGYDPFLVRRALAFAERNMEDARAILLADKMDEEEEEKEKQSKIAKKQQQQKETEPMKTVNVAANFDPTKVQSQSAPAFTPPPVQKNKKVTKEDVVFEANGSQVFELVLESPVPVLLDIYADWCGPCKALSPILEEMAVKSNGAFRLVKVNSDNEKAIAGALQVSSLPTVFGVRDGKIIHMFKGMPRSEEMLKNFMMGLLIPGQTFNPPVTQSENEYYTELTNRIIKIASAACFPFSLRERLQEIVTERMDELVDKQTNGDVLIAEQAAQTIRSLLSTVIRDPFETKYRSINLTNKIIAERIGKYPACVAILKAAGFTMDSTKASMSIGKGKKIVNTAPLAVARDSIDKWIDKTRYEVAKAARKKKDEADRVHVQAELAAAAAAAEAEKTAAAKNKETAVDPNECKLKVRLVGKQKIHDITFHADDDTLQTVLDKLPNFILNDDEEAHITCVAKRLIVKSNDTNAMGKSLREHGLMPAAALVIKIVNPTTNKEETNTSTSLAERAAARKKKKTGSHTMQSVGIYGKDDNAKGELIDGGGGVLYEHDVTDDDEEEEKAPSKNDNEKDDTLAEGTDKQDSKLDYDDDDQYSEVESDKLEEE